MQKYIKDITLIGAILLCGIGLLMFLNARMKAETESQKWHKFVLVAVMLFSLPVPISFLRVYLLPNSDYVRVFDLFYIACFVCAFLLLIKGNKRLKKAEMEKSDIQEEK